jgi:hypothetical protein
VITVVAGLGTCDAGCSSQVARPAVFIQWLTAQVDTEKGIRHRDLHRLGLVPGGEALRFGQDVRAWVR